MTLKDIVRSNTLDEHTFGKFVRKRREELGYSMRAFAQKINCSAAYVSDIEKGNRYAPKAKLRAIFEELKLSEEEWPYFEDLAASTRGLLYEDINAYFNKKPIACIAMRKAMDADFTDEQWRDIIGLMGNEDD